MSSVSLRLSFVIKRMADSRVVAEELKRSSFYSKRLLFSIGLFSGISWAWEGDRLGASYASLEGPGNTVGRASQSSSRLSAQE